VIEWVLASGNKGKLREFQQLVAGQGIRLVPQQALGILEVAETGLSFVENALIKARHASAISGLPALADDSGLIVNALRGAPGLHTARYAGPDASADDNINKLLAAMSGVPDAERTAHFVAVLAVVRDALDPCPLIAQGEWHGKILSARRGGSGFGYDPVFFDETYSLSAAEMSNELKNRLSHRGRAVEQLRSQLPKFNS